MSVFLSIISTGATLASIFMLMSPILTMLELQKKRSVGAMTILFFCAQLVNCSVWSLYGVLKRAFPIMICNTLGNAIATWCILNFITIIRVEEKSGHIPKATTYKESFRTALCAVLLIVVFFIIIFLLYTYGSLALVSVVNGVGGGCTSVFMLSSPLGMATEIIKNKNAEPLQPITVGFATINSVLWTLYGLLTSDPFVYVPNSLCTFACFFQIFLIVRYGRHPAEAKEEVKEAFAAVPI